MTVLGALFSGISGLNSNEVAMEIIGNNIANINTPGFKGSRPNFGDVLSKTLASGFSIGRGSQIQSTSQVFTQGGFQATDNVTDLAIEGAGFFMVRDPGNLGQYFSRAGNFRIDENGYLVTTAGMRVQGFGVDSDGVTIGTSSDIQIRNTPLPPRVTGDGTNGTGVTINLNLSSDSTVAPGGPAFDINDPVTTSNFVNSISVYDSLGNSHQISVYYRRASDVPSVWEWYAVVPDAEATSGTATIGASGTLEFDTEGALVAETIVTPPAFDFVGGGTQGQAIGIDFGESIADGGTGFSGTTQFGEESAVVFQAQDGFGPSYLSSIDINPDGIVFGKFANGETVNFGRIAIARFTAQERLTQVGGNLFSESVDSGPAALGVPSSGGNGRVFANTLELSNVDMASQFVQMITTQRGFQANSRLISTADQMMQELVNVTR
ncbi:MAG: flagellar hook protein FlgE [Deltaproteobacteria bacterium]|nr:flagellar hook protein FlgE [Deltaproteobacteria bacterium]